MRAAKLSLVALVACLPEVDAPITGGPCPAPPEVELEVPPDESFAHVIDKLESKEPLLLEGHQWDHTLVRDCVMSEVEGDAIRLKDVHDVWIVGCVFERGTGGIRLLAAGGTSSVTIARNRFHQLRGMSVAILEAEGVEHRGARVIGNRFESVGLAGTQGRSPAILAVARDYLLEANSICEPQGGDGIHAGGPGLISRNFIRNAKRSAIRYIPPEAGFPGPGGRLEVVNNIAVGLFGSSTYAILGGGPGVADAVFSFNTGVHFSSRDAVLSIQEGAPKVSAFGNLWVHTLDVENTVAGALEKDEANYKQAALEGFVSDVNPIDLHLGPSHPALGAAGTLAHPGFDFDGDPRPGASGRSDPGADQTRFE
ncbi:MAG: right-handed parallel beta-helix repeat-containing protein [Deltaproteobacteria bacterium]|nr:right-handed parallel beta-helix repeat-containing protein [Deltaproteobacteria bacterium]